MLIVGFPLALVLSWAFELTPEGVKRVQGDTGESGAHRTSRKLIAVTATFASLALGMFLFRISRPQPDPPVEIPNQAPNAISEKSIAVLPFENLSANQENAFFADGVQDEILTDLARIADLKVISRTSVMQYKSGVARNARVIAQALGVAHLLEGSVQRVGGKVRVNAQLIDARSDKHVWAQTYDRDLADVFAIQSEIAKTIADQLQAKLSPRGKVEIERQPTTDIGAFDLYTRGKALLQTISLGSTAKDNLLQGIELLNQAVARDPVFFDAYCQLGLGHDLLYFFGLDHTETRRLLAESAVRTAVRLRPDAGETHLAQADYLYRYYLDYNRACPELEIAARLLPNRPLVFMEMASINRRQGRWQDGLRNLEKALELDPQNIFPLQQIALFHQYLRQFPEMAKALDRALALMPNDVDSRSWRSLVELDWKADPKPLHETIHSILSENPAAAESLTDLWLYLAFTTPLPPHLSQLTTLVVFLPFSKRPYSRVPRLWGFQLGS